MRTHLVFAGNSYLLLKQISAKWKLVFSIIVLLSSNSRGQGNLAMQNFESSGSNYNYINTNGMLQTGSSGSTDKPASATFYTSGNTGFRVSNQTAVLNFENKTGLQSYHLKKVSLRLAAFSIASTSNGLDATDKVTLSVSLNGGISFSDELTVKGNSNASWHYTTGTGNAIVNYDGNNVPIEFAPAGGGNRTSDGYSNLIVNLPDTCSQVKLKITLNDDSSNEAWLIDDVFLSSCIPPQFTNCPADFVVSTDVHACNSLINYNASAASVPDPVYSYVFSGATSVSGTGIGSASFLNQGMTDVVILASNPCGMATCAFSVKVIDAKPPVIVCPPTVNYQLKLNSCGPIIKDSIVLGSATSTDNCGMSSISNVVPDLFFSGGNKVIWIATDKQSNSSSCVQDVNIIPYKCGQASQIYSTDIGITTAKIKWKSNTCNTDFQLRIRKEISSGVWSSWSDWNNSNNSLNYAFTGLQGNVFYHYQIRGICGSAFSKTVNGWFRTNAN